MENLNLPPLYVGQKVVYITGNNMPKGTTDIIIDIKKSVCKCVEYVILLQNNRSVLNKPSGPHITHFECKGCGVIYPVLEAQNGYWHAASFRPVEEMKFPLIKYSKVLEEVLVGEN